MRRRRGFTLLEMLVVLVILAIVAQTAIVAVDGLVDAERRAATVRALEGAEHAIVGRRGVVDASGRAWIEGFVADVGRLPQPSASGQLEELWVAPPGVASFAQHPVTESELIAGATLATGWRGPYLRLPLGDSTFTDGWARPFGVELATDPPVLTLQSLGSDGLEDPTPSSGYDADIAVSLDRSDCFGVFTVDWTPKVATDEVRIELWVPVDGKPRVKSVGWIAAGSAAVSYTLNDAIPIGHHALVVGRRDAATKTMKSVLRRPITVVPLGIAGGDPMIDLEAP